MSQELIAIIGAATVALALAVTAHAQVDCADWNTAAFFEAAEVSDVTRCLQMGAAPEVRNEFGYTPLHSAAWSGAGEAVTALLKREQPRMPEQKVEKRHCISRRGPGLLKA